MKRKSVMKQISKEKLIDIINKSSSISDVIRSFNLRVAGKNFETLIDRLKKDNINYSHLLIRKYDFNKKETVKILVKNSNYNVGSLKRRLIAEKILSNVCKICGQLPEWNGKKLTLILDHINGDSRDHRKNNLRILCPNCDSQQITYRGKNKKKKYYCINCNNVITKHSNSGLCVKCSSVKVGMKNRKTDRPSYEELMNDVSKMSFVATGRKYKVSDNTIRKWIKYYENK